MQNKDSKKFAVQRDWGVYDVLANFKNMKVKELVVSPNSCMSFQRHKHRSEFWIVESGIARVILANDFPESCSRGDLNRRQELIERAARTVILHKHDHLHVPKGEWHQVLNPSHVPLHIVEIQYGEFCDEVDIERLYQ